MASSGQAAVLDALTNFKYEYFVRHWGREVLFLIYHNCLLDETPGKIRDIIMDKRISLDNYGFFKGEKNNLDKPDNLDITALAKICMCLWKEGFKDPGDKLKGRVGQIRDERNTVCHEKAEISPTALPTAVEKFRNVLDAALREAKVVFPHYGAEIGQLRDGIKRAVPEILKRVRETYDPQSPQDMKKLQDETKLYWDEFSEFIVKHSQEELACYNKDLCKVRPYDWLVQYQATDPSNFVINLKMDQEKEFHGGPERSHCISIDEVELFRIKDRNGKEPKSLLISGDAGTGKTTLLSSIMEKHHTATDETTDLSSFQILLYMQFRNHAQDNFDEYLRSLLPKITSLFGIEHVKASILKSKCLILCDGFDEANQKSENVFKDILSLNCPEMKIIVTTRPSNTERLTNFLNKAKHHRINLKILGLTTRDMEQLIERMTNMLIVDVTRKEETKEKLSQAINNIDESMRQSLKVPLYFNLYILLCIECPDLWNEIRSVTILYIQLKKHMFKRIIERTEILEESLDEFEILYNEWSLPHYIYRKFELSDYDVAELKHKIQSQEVLQHFDFIMSSYFTVKHKLNNLDINKVFCYRHRSEQEFTVANIVCKEIIKLMKNKKDDIFGSVLSSTGILQLISDEQDELFEVYRQAERVKELLPFIVGVLYTSNKDTSYEAISDIHKYLLYDQEREVELDSVLATMSEATFDPRVFESLVTVLESLPGKRDYIIRKEKNLHPLLLLVPRLSSKHAEELRIDINSLGPKALPVLMEIVSDANKQCIPVHVKLALHLQELSALSEQALDTSDPASFLVDKLEIAIVEREEVDLDGLHLHPLPLTPEVLYLSVFMKWINIRDVPQIVNSIWPKMRKSDVTKKEENRNFSLLSSGLFHTADDPPARSDEDPVLSCHFSRPDTSTRKYMMDQLSRVAHIFERKGDKLHILSWSSDGNRYTDEDIRFVLESLTIHPLPHSDFLINVRMDRLQDEYSLRELCQEKGLGTLMIGNGSVF